MAVKALGWFLAPAMALAVALLVGLALAAAEPELTQAAGAQAAECQTAGVVPGSMEILSDSNLAGAVSGHTLRFRLCPYPNRPAAAGNAAGPPVYPDSLSLLWNRSFYLYPPAEKGIVLTATGTGKSWPAAAPYGPRSCYASLQGTGVSVKFAAAEGLNGLIPAADRNIPVTLQFAIPETAGMINPFFSDGYEWRIALHYDRGEYGDAYTATVMMPVVAPPLASTAGISLSQNGGSPGTTVTVAGQGFPPLSPVQSVQVDWLDVTPADPVSTDARGRFRMDIIIPGVEVGWHLIQVKVGGIPAAIRFTVAGFVPGLLDTPIPEAIVNLGDNLVRVFHFDSSYNGWTFYDPQVPEVSTLTYFVQLGCYWILVKEPAEVILNRQTRNLTCPPDGKCWNFIVW